MLDCWALYSSRIAAMKFQTTTRPLRELVQEFSAGAILLPQFQRNFVWRPSKILNLLDSLLRGFPIGGFYLWRPAVGDFDVKPKALGKQRIAPVFGGYLIDGQQRLTSLEAAFGLYTGEDRDGSELRCYLDLAAANDESARDTRLFVSYAGKMSVRRRVEQGDSTLIPVSELFTGQHPELRKESEEVLQLIPGWDRKRVDDSLQHFDRACNMLNQQVPCTTVSEVGDQDAVEVFSRLNKGGSALTQGDVRATELARGPTVRVLKLMREFVTGERERRLGFYPIGWMFQGHTAVPLTTPGALAKEPSRRCLSSSIAWGGHAEPCYLRRTRSSCWPPRLMRLTLRCPPMTNSTIGDGCA